MSGERSGGAARRAAGLTPFSSPLRGGASLGAEEMDAGARPGGAGQPREYKLVMLGAGGVGKSGACGPGGPGGLWGRAVPAAP